MDRQANLPEQRADFSALMSGPFLKALRKVLAGIYAVIDGELTRHRGGPGILRQLASIVTTFLAITIIMRVRQRAIAVRSDVIIAASTRLRHLSHPPAGWAAP